MCPSKLRGGSHLVIPLLPTISTPDHNPTAPKPQSPKAQSPKATILLFLVWLCHIFHDFYVSFGGPIFPSQFFLRCPVLNPQPKTVFKAKANCLGAMGLTNPSCQPYSRFSTGSRPIPRSGFGEGGGRGQGFVTIVFEVLKFFAQYSVTMGQRVENCMTLRDIIYK